MSEWAKDLLPWAAPLLTLAGWFLVNKQNNARESRKEARSAADRCKILTRESAQLGIKYWEAKPDATSWQVKALLEELEVEICRFPEKKGRPDLLAKHIDLVEAIMGYDFDSARMQPKTPTDPVMRDIAKARQRLLFEVEHQFEAHYQ